MEHESENPIDCCWCIYNGPQGLGEGTAGSGIQRKNQDYSDYR